MATFIVTVSFTAEGVKEFGDTTKRANAFKTAAKKLGVKVKDIYWTLGKHDGVLILEAADDAAVTGALLQLGARGFVHTSTARAFSASEMDKIIAKARG